MIEVKDALYELNKEIIRIKNSPQYKNIEKKELLKSYLIKKDIRSLLMHTYIKLNKNRYYSSIGNNKYKIIELKKDSRKSRKKLAIYTVVVGKYDHIFEPYYVNPNADYFIFTDQNIDKDSIWKKVDITLYDEYNQLSNMMLSRKIKLLSHIYLNEYDYTVYIDGNIRIISDLSNYINQMNQYIFAAHTHAVRDCVYLEGNSCILAKKSNKDLIVKQLSKYKNEKFPEHFGLFQNSIIIRRKSKMLVNIEKEWWNETKATNTRDQLSLPYVLWKLDIPLNMIGSLGSNAYTNPCFQILDHR